MKTKNITSSIFWAIVLIAVGTILLLRNAGLMPQYLYQIVISWQMLLLAIGVDQFLKWKLTSGTVLVVIGGVFLIPEIFNFGLIDLHTMWPVILIIIGVCLLAGMFSRRCCRSGVSSRRGSQTGFECNEGFVTSENSFNSAQHTVTDRTFRGGEIRNSFASTTIDLRQTTLFEAQTTIHIESSFGKVELLMPPQWRVRVAMSLSFGSCDDRRVQGSSTDVEHEVVLTGRAAFGGVEIR